MNVGDRLTALEQRNAFDWRKMRYWLLVLLVAGALATLWAAQQQKLKVLSDILLNGEERLELYASTLKSAVARFEYLPYLTATDKEVGQLLRMTEASAEEQKYLNQKLQRWQEASGASVLYVMDASGEVLASSNFDTDHSFVGHDYHFRPYFRDAMAGRAGRFFAIGFTTGLPGFFLSYPVSDHDQVIGAAVVKLDLSTLERNWAAGGERVLVADRDSVVFLASRTDWKYNSLSALDEGTRQRLVDEHKYSSRQIGLMPVQQRKMAGRDLAVLQSSSDEWLLMSRELDLLDGTLYFLPSLKPMRERARDTALMGIMSTVLLGLLGSLWLMRQVGLRQSRINAAKLARSAAEQRQIIRDTQAGLITTDEAFSVTFANPTAIAIFDRPLESLAQTPLTGYLCAPDQSGDCGLKLLQGDADVELDVLHPDQSRVSVLLSSRPIGKQRGYLITVHDISQIKEAEQALREAHDELEQRVERRTQALNDANRQLREEIRERARAEQELVETQNELIQAAKLAALGQMSAGIVHEINQPLAAIHTYLSSARLLLQRGDQQAATENVEEIQNLVRRMNTLISHLKSFASRSDGKLQPVSLDTVIANTLVLLRPRLDKLSVALNIQKPEAAVWVVGDEIRLEQVLVNLIRNALDAVEGQPDASVEVALEPKGDTVDISITDNGPGIADHHLDHLFDPFFTTKEVGEGMGLGLSVSYGIAREMGGQLAGGNRSEGGARFTLSLIPASPGERNAA